MDKPDRVVVAARGGGARTVSSPTDPVLIHRFERTAIDLYEAKKQGVEGSLYDVVSDEYILAKSALTSSMTIAHLAIDDLPPLVGRLNDLLSVLDAIDLETISKKLEFRMIPWWRRIFR